ncbi:Crp/Fnr family transcriptional regulator [Enterovirga aerilata]|uniref:Crp/Fnr family transcriptional regulator n=1 Tax=Enterovirga aerilata TaxID=2730920 RepID=A0A849HYZ3_9HYPH|nr:Crp/Fnr family transcriptional regulator [Enterovirga sp. DB1703]NNM72756.1 Crp/Fnr family transcriptional regulator [Enterovirga sp. DB1703]
MSTGIGRHAAASRLFSDLEPEAVALILARASLLRVGEGSLLVRQGDPPGQLMLLNRGRAKVSRVTDDGRQATLRFMGAGELIGCAAVFRNFAYPASVSAAEPCEVHSWPRDQFMSLMERHPRLAVNALVVVSGQLEEMARRELGFGADPVRKRLAAELLRLVGSRDTPEEQAVELRMTRQDLGELVGTTLFTVSRILTAWAREGIVASGRERVLVRDRPRLARIAAGEA